MRSWYVDARTTMHDMGVEVKKPRLCEVPGCQKTPAWNRKAQAFYRFCFEHGRPGAVPEPTEWTVTQLPTVMPEPRKARIRKKRRRMGKSGEWQK